MAKKSSYSKTKYNRGKAREELLKDIAIVFVGVVLAVLASKSGIIDDIPWLWHNTFISSFITGIFFTSVFTLAPASIVLAHLSTTTSVNEVVVLGALGAVVGDLVLFFFVKDRFTRDLLNSLKPSFIKRILKSLHLGFLKYIAPIFGALLIASPLPDELGLMLLGMSRTRTAVLIPISFVMNMVGIYSIIWFASVIS